MSKWLKNADTISRTWSGQVIASGAYYEIEEIEKLGFSTSSSLLSDIGSGIAIMAKDDSGTKDITDVNEAINFLKDIDPNPRSASNKIFVHQTSRDPGFTTYFASSDDSDTDFMSYGGTTNVREMFWTHQSGVDPTEGQIYFDLNTIANETHLHEGYLQWQNAENDYVTLEFVPKVTTVTSGSGTNYDLFSGYLVVPAAPGTGSTVIADNDRVLIQVATDLDTGLRNSSGYWDADFNTTTKLFENIVPNYAGTGGFNMFSTEVVLSRFVNRMRLLGSGFMNMQTSDKSQIGHGMRMRLTFGTQGADHTWSGNASFTLHRRVLA